MLVEQKKMKRQSQILLQTSAPNQALTEALEQVCSLTQELETERLLHQKQVCAFNIHQDTFTNRRNKQNPFISERLGEFLSQKESSVHTSHRTLCAQDTPLKVRLSALVQGLRIERFQV